MMTKTPDGYYAQVRVRTPADAITAISPAIQDPEDRVSVEVGEIKTRTDKSALVQYLNTIQRPFGLVIVRPINPPRNEYPTD